MMGCPNCGRTFESQEKVCPFCGQSLNIVVVNDNENNDAEKSKSGNIVFDIILFLIAIVCLFLVKIVIVKAIIAVILFVIAETKTKNEGNSLFLSLTRIVTFIQILGVIVGIISSIIM